MPNEKILASVGGNPITESDVNAAVARYGQKYDNPQGRAMILEQLINDKLFYLDAVRNVYEREPEFKAQLNAVKAMLLSEYAMKKAAEGAKVTEADARKYYEENSEQMVAGKTYNASHILVDSEEKANELLGKIKAGETTFEAAAAEFSSCPSGKNGGNLGDFTKGQMVPEFEQACDALSEGEISAPVKTQFGYHIIRLNSVSEAQALKFEDVHDEIIAALTREKQQSALQSRINQLKILYPVDKSGEAAPKSSILL